MILNLSNKIIHCILHEHRHAVELYAVNNHWWVAEVVYILRQSFHLVCSIHAHIMVACDSVFSSHSCRLTGRFISGSCYFCGQRFCKRVQWKFTLTLPSAAKSYTKLGILYAKNKHTANYFSKKWRLSGLERIIWQWGRVAHYQKSGCPPTRLCRFSMVEKACPPTRLYSSKQSYCQENDHCNCDVPEDMLI